MSSDGVQLDLGSGPSPEPGYEGVDREALGQEYVVHLWSGRSWPFRSNSIRALRASHVIEHIELGDVELEAPSLWREQNRFFFFFDEAYRVIEPDGLFELHWPVWNSVYAHQDPTHHRFIPVSTLLYLSQPGRAQLGVDRYRVRCDWRLVGDVLEHHLGDQPFAYQATLRAHKNE